MAAKQGLYYNINRRRKLGLPAKQPGQKGYPAATAFRQSAKTAEKKQARRG
jgi:hypothetical protein